jgi:hypothetical protein
MSQAKPRFQQALKRALAFAGLAALGLLAIGMGLGFAVDLGSLVKPRLEAQLPKLEARLGRKVRLGRTHLRLLPAPNLQLGELVIEAAPGERGLAAEPLLQLGAVRVRIALWPALVSLGKRLVIEAIELDALRLQVVRGPGGQLSYEDVLARLAEPPADKTPLSPEQLKWLAELTIKRAALRGGAIRLYDLSAEPPAAAPLSIDPIDFVATDVRLLQSFPLTLELAVFAPAPNLHVGLTLGPWPSDLNVSVPLSVLRHLELKLRPLQLAPLLRFVPASSGVGLKEALLQAELRLDNPVGATDLRLATEVQARGLVLADHGAPTAPCGKKADLQLGLELSANLLGGDVKLAKLELLLDDMAVRGYADLRQLWRHPALYGLSLQSQGLSLERLTALLPATALPPEMTLRGPLVLRGAGSGTPAHARVELSLDATAATVLLPALRKPEGTPLVLELRGELGEKAMAIERLGVSLGPMALLLSGQVRSSRDFDLKIDTGRVALSALLPLLPSVSLADAEDAPTPPSQELRLAGTVQQGEAELRVAAELELPGGAVRGNAAIDQTPDPRPARLELFADSLDLDQLLPVKGPAKVAPSRLAGALPAPGRLLSALRKLEVFGKLAVTRAKLRGVVVKDIALEATLSQGQLAVKTLRAAALGGQLNLSGSSLDFSGERPRFGVRAHLQRIDLSQLLAAQKSELLHRLHGRGSLELHVDGQGQSMAEIAPRLHGSLALSLSEGRLTTPSLGVAVVGPLLARLYPGQPNLNLPAEQTMTVEELSAQFRIEGGKLHTTAPLYYRSDEGTLNLQGTIGLDRSLGLGGELYLSPRAFAGATGGRLVPDRDIPIALRVGGSLAKPEVSLVDPLKTMAALAAALVRGKGAQWLRSHGLPDFLGR